MTRATFDPARLERVFVLGLGLSGTAAARLLRKRGIGVVARVSRLLHTPLMSITNAISAIAVVGSILVTGSDYPKEIRILNAVALFASMTNIVRGFLITNRMVKMFKQEPKEAQPK